MEHHDTGLEHDAETVSVSYDLGLILGRLIMFVLPCLMFQMFLVVLVKCHSFMPLARLDLFCVKDMLLSLHSPHRYFDFTKMTDQRTLCGIKVHLNKHKTHKNQ